MKTNILSFAFIFLFSVVASTLFAQGKIVKANIKVFGNCGMCKKRIETALDRPGVKTASWDAETKNLVIVYNSKKITEQEIHEIIATAGHDTEKVKAKNEVYADLPFCCLYRDHDHSGMKDAPHKDH